MKNCIIVHGCPSTSKDTSYNKHRIPWLKKELATYGIKSESPTMPSPRIPVYEDYKKKFEKNKNEINKNTTLIGHSCGCAFLVRRLGETKIDIDKLILVAPWKINDEGDIYRDLFYSYEIDSTISKRTKKIVMFTSNNEHDLGKESLQIFHKAIGGEVINLHNKGHYTKRDMGTDKFPELLQKIV